MNNRVIEIITNRIIEQLEQGTLPWKQPWFGLPQNLVTRKVYRGINAFSLAWSGFESPYWATYKQVASLGGQVRKGEKGTPIVYWNWVHVTESQDNDTGFERRIPFAKYFTVFNASQCTLPATVDTDAKDRIIECEQVIDGMPDKPVIKHEGLRACYIPRIDEVHIPAINCFASAEHYYATLYHEAIHSTGHPRRLDREGVAETSGFAESYSREELVAEFGAAYLCGLTGIENRTIDNSAAYIQGWSRKLSGDRSIIIQAASAAQKAVDWILDVQPGDESNVSEN